MDLNSFIEKFNQEKDSLHQVLQNLGTAPSRQSLTDNSSTYQPSYAYFLQNPINPFSFGNGDNTTGLMSSSATTALLSSIQSLQNSISKNPIGPMVNTVIPTAHQHSVSISSTITETSNPQRLNEVFKEKLYDKTDSWTPISLTRKRTSDEEKATQDNNSMFKRSKKDSTKQVLPDMLNESDSIAKFSTKKVDSTSNTDITKNRLKDHLDILEPVAVQTKTKKKNTAPMNSTTRHKEQPSEANIVDTTNVPMLTTSITTSTTVISTKRNGAPTIQAGNITEIDLLTRQGYVNDFYNQYMKIYNSHDTSSRKSVQSELDIAKKSIGKGAEPVVTYRSACVSFLYKLKQQKQFTQPESRSTSSINNTTTTKANITTSSELKQKLALEIEHSASCKIPLTVRSQILEKIYSVMITKYSNKNTALTEAKKEERDLVNKAKGIPNLYKNLCANLLTNLRNAPKSNEVEKTNTDKKQSTSVKSTLRKLSAIEKYLLTEEERLVHDFPVEMDIPLSHDHETNGEPGWTHEYTCVRCGQQFKYPLAGDSLGSTALFKCIYHSGKLRTVEKQRRYTCCGGDVGSKGCTDGVHVYDNGSYKEMLSRGILFRKSQNSSETPTIDTVSLIGIDCEMCYTTNGLELVRVTLVNENHDTLYDTLVKPEGIIVDYNTQFSGISKDSFKDGSSYPTFSKVQDTLLNKYIFADKTVLVGHSLQSDLKSLHIIHDKVMDTSVLYPHKQGLPYKRSLKELASSYLKKFIQQPKSSNGSEIESGHDSLEDAIASLDLATLKLSKGHLFGIIY